MNTSYRFARKHAIGDGNCFFHALAELIYQDYSPQIGIDLRLKVAGEFHLIDYIHLENCSTAVFNLLDKPALKNVSLSDNIFGVPVDALIDSSSYEPALKAALMEYVQSDYMVYKQKLSTPHAWTEEWMISFAASLLRVNILIYTSDQIWLSPRELQKGKPVVFIFNWREAHYDPLFLEKTNEDGSKLLCRNVEWNEAEEIIKMVK